MPISEADALAIHAAIHGGKADVKLSSGDTVPVAKKNGLRFAEVAGVKGMEQNKAKSSQWAEKAKKGAKITWFLGAMPWGRVVGGAVDDFGATIAAPEAAAKKAAPHGKAAAKKAKAAPEEPPGPPPKKKAAEPPPGAPPEKKAKVSSGASSSSSDPLALAPLFSGKGHGGAWEPILRPVIEGLPDAAKFIGPARDKRIVPVRELTFQALKPNPPGGWRVISLGQSPFPRIGSATGIAHFDSAIGSWDDSRFGAVVTMRCIVKAAAMGKFGAPKAITQADLRALLKKKGCVGPAEWFQAMLVQGVLFMNAACTLLPPEDKSVRAGSVVEEHARFWQPVVEAVLGAILEECSRSGRGIVFAWWGSESLKTKRALQKTCFARFADVRIEHIEHKNPAAMADAFCDPPNIFGQINKALDRLKLGKIDWLPVSGWKEAVSASGMVRSGSAVEQMGDFITETQELHKMYLERLKDGLDKRSDDLADITGISSKPLVSLADACKELGLGKFAGQSVDKAKGFSRGKLTVEEAAAVHLYTTNHLYKALNESLRSDDRKTVDRYFLYLRLLLSALQKLPACTKRLYRGVALDLSAQYPEHTRATWWAVSSCTPSLAVAGSFGGAGKRTLFEITPTTGAGIKDLSEYKDEEEFILAPGTQFEITQVEHQGKLIKIHLRELDGARRVR